MPKDAFYNLRQDKQARLLASAMDSFLNKDYEQLTIRDLLEAMEISTGSFYNYFIDKDDLYLYLMDTIYAKLHNSGYHHEDFIVRIRDQSYSDCLTEDEWQILHMYYFLPDEVIKKYVLREEGATFGNTNVEASFQELQRRGVIRKNLDLDLAVYLYKSISYISVLYAKSTGVTDIEQLRTINRTLYYDLFINGVIER